MNFSEFLIALRARRKAFALAAVIMTAVAVALGSYREVRRQCDAAHGRARRAADDAAPQRPGLPHDPDGSSAPGRVAGQVVRDLKLAAKPGVREAWEQATAAILIEDWPPPALPTSCASMWSRATCSTSSSLPAIQLPATGQRLQQGLSRHGACCVLESTREAASWFGRAAKSMRAQLTEAQTKVAGFQKAKGITSTEERSDIEVARLDTLSGQYSTARNATYEAIGMDKQALEPCRTASTSTRCPKCCRAVDCSSSTSSASAVFDQEGTVLGENHPQYLRTKAEIQAINDKIAHEGRAGRRPRQRGAAGEEARRRSSRPCCRRRKTA